MAPPTTYPPYTSDTPSPETDEETEQAKAAVRSMIGLNIHIARRRNIPIFDLSIMQNFTVISASGHPSDSSRSRKASVHPSSLLEIPTLPGFANSNNVLHGGAISTILDMATGTALAPIQSEEYWGMMGGVSWGLNVSFLKACPVEGQNVRIRSWVVKHGRTACLIRGQIESVDGGVVYATGEHTKLQTPLDGERLGLIREWKEIERERERERGRGQGKRELKL